MLQRAADRPNFIRMVNTVFDHLYWFIDPGNYGDIQIKVSGSGEVMIRMWAEVWKRTPLRLPRRSAPLMAPRSLMVMQLSRAVLALMLLKRLLCVYVCPHPMDTALVPLALKQGTFPCKFNFFTQSVSELRKQRGLRCLVIHAEFQLHFCLLLFTKQSPSPSP
jgi:hypothetical protein